MKIIYDSNAPYLEKCYVVTNEGEKIICGCFDLKIETVKEEAHIKRWGKASDRKGIHKKVSQIKEPNNAN